MGLWRLIKCRHQTKSSALGMCRFSLMCQLYDCQQGLNAAGCSSVGQQIPLLCIAVYFGNTCGYFDTTLGKTSQNVWRISWQKQHQMSFIALDTRLQTPPELSRAGHFSSSTSNIAGCGKWFPVSPSAGNPPKSQAVCAWPFVHMMDVALLPPKFSPWRNFVFHKHHL